MQGDVAILYEAGANRMGTDESDFIRVFATRHMEHLKQVFQLYNQLHGHTMRTVVKKEFSGALETALLQFGNTVPRLA